MMWMTHILPVKLICSLLIAVISMLFPRFGYDYQRLSRPPLVSFLLLILIFAAGVTICKFAYEHYYGPLVEASYGKDDTP